MNKMIKIKERDYFMYLLPFVLVLFYLTEGYYKIFNSSTTLLKLTKSVFLATIVAYIAIKKYKLLFFPLVLSVIFLIGQSNLENAFQFNIVVNFSKYLYLILLLLFLEVFDLSVKQRRLLFKAFETVIYLNSALIILGFFCDILFFKAYGNNRFGFNGLIITSATSSYIYIITLIYLLLKRKQKLFKTPSAYVIICAALLVGTKSIYLFFIGFIAIYLVWYSKIQFKKILLLLLFTMAAVLGYFFLFEYGLFNDIRKTDGLLSAIMSYRGNLFFERTQPFIDSNWGFLNYLFGGIDNPATKSQIDLVDIFYFFGIIGGIIYLYAFFSLFYKFKIDLQIVFLTGLLFFIAFFAGNFFSYASVGIYILILKEFLNTYESN